jgi:uncharacterized protein
MQIFCCALRVELLIPGCTNLKAKRAVIRPLIEGIRNRHHVSVAEVGAQDIWGRSIIAIAAISSTEHITREILDEVDRFVWSWPEIEIVSCTRAWLDDLGFEEDQDSDADT